MFDIYSQENISYISACKALKIWRKLTEMGGKSQLCIERYELITEESEEENGSIFCVHHFRLLRCNYL